jgi:hypothetical protein
MWLYRIGNGDDNMVTCVILGINSVRRGFVYSSPFCNKFIKYYSVIYITHVLGICQGDNLLK